MKVEVFRNDTDCEPADAQAEALALIEELELEGQRSLVSGDGRMPWTTLTSEQRFVIRQLCPATTAVGAYTHDAIPLRILSLIREVREDFHRLDVWHPAKAAEPDPFLVGVKDASWNSPMYLLARWGSELLSWTELEERAMAAWRSKRRGQMAKLAAEARAHEESLDGITLSVAAKLQDYPSLFL